MKANNQAFYRICDRVGNVLEEDYLRVHADATGIRKLVKKIMKSWPNAHYAEYRIRGNAKMNTLANF